MKKILFIALAFAATLPLSAQHKITQEHKDRAAEVVKQMTLEEIAQMMVDYRSNPPTEMAGSPVIKVIDYSKPEETGLPASNVLQFYNEAGDVVTVRPSGTEPKIKFYFGIKGADADAKNEVLRAQFSK